MQDSGYPTEQGQQDVEAEIQATASLYQDDKWREEDGDEDEEAVFCRRHCAWIIDVVLLNAD